MVRGWVSAIISTVKIEKPRTFSTSRDLFISLGVLGVIMALSVGFTGMCSYDPGSADKSGPVQEVDVDTILGTEARSLSFPVRNPEVPEDWQANSGRRISVDDEPSTVAGWVIDERYYVSLTQTDVELEDAVDFQNGEDTAVREETDTHSSPGEDGPVTWHIYTGEDARSLWAADLDGVTLMVSGTASPEMYETMADRVVKTEPIDINAPMDD
jgi:hypothetical protein